MRKTKPLEERFWAKVDRRGPDECWLWTGALADGYGRISTGGRADGLEGAHRVAYKLLVGPIPDGMEIDHVRDRGCVHRHCVNPAHLEAVTGEENRRRALPFHPGRNKTHCKHGHPFDERNTALRGRARVCRSCERKRSRQYARRLREGATP